MRFRLFYVFKIAQTAIIAFCLWRLLSETLICGSFVSVKVPFHHGIRGACEGLFFYVYPKTPSIRDKQPKNRPQLRLWWFFEGSNFLPSPPTQQEVERLVKEVKKELNAGSRRWRRTTWIRQEDKFREKRNFGRILLGKENNNNDGKTIEDNRRYDAFDDGTKLFCYEFNLQGSSSPEALSLQQTKGGSPPPVILGNRSVVTVAFALAHFLLLFAQIFLLNCLDEDNFEQKRGKLVFATDLPNRSFPYFHKFDWDAMWLCTNFRPKLLSMVIIIQVVAAVLILMSLLEGIRVFLSMQKYDRLIERMKQGKLNKYRPRA
uniref:Uncharacterized protein n=1 Tax=Globodera pallida TaxID=36090 RepID=A0A183CEY9_GLOPA